MDKEIGFRL